jgi:hypothetical protein
MSYTTMFVGAVAGVVIGDMVAKKLGDKLPDFPYKGTVITGASVVGSLVLARKFLG